MIAGARLTAVARRCLHPTTFRLIVSPAIADLQFDASRGSRLITLQAYVGVWRALAGALWIDCAWRLESLIADEARLSTLRSDLLTFAWLAVFQLGYFLGPFTIVFGGSARLQAWFSQLSESQVLLVALFALVPIVPLVVLFSCAHRMKEGPCVES